ncbi:MAG: ATP-grasp domain-containing protein [Bacteroidota bacterium]
MIIIYCDSVLDHQVIEPDYEAEKEAALAAGLSTALISFEALEEGDLRKALRYVPQQEKPSIGLYRGWMLRPEQYRNLAEAFQSRNITLINDPPAYQHCHYLPESFAHIQSLSPETHWLPLDGEADWNKIFSLTDQFGQSPIIVKDYVKSEKHHWDTACFIPDATDHENVKRIVSHFLELRGNSLNEGLVFRRFEKLQYLTEHSQSGMPLTREYRLFFFRGNILAAYPYWEEGEYAAELPDFAPFASIANQVQSHFFTMDVALKESGEWMIMELGDGQVAGLPDRADATNFYLRLSQLAS